MGMVLSAVINLAFCDFYCQKKATDCSYCKAFGKYIHGICQDYFQFVPCQYQIDTSQLDEDFIEKLSLRSGVPKEKVKKLVDYMAWLKQKEDLQEIHLTRLNQFIEAFHNN